MPSRHLQTSRNPLFAMHCSKILWSMYAEFHHCLYECWKIRRAHRKYKNTCKNTSRLLATPSPQSTIWSATLFCRLFTNNFIISYINLMTTRAHTQKIYQYLERRLQTSYIPYSLCTVRWATKLCGLYTQNFIISVIIYIYWKDRREHRQYNKTCKNTCRLLTTLIRYVQCGEQRYFVESIPRTASSFTYMC